MPQIFHRSFNSLSRVSIAGTAILLAVLGLGGYEFFRSSLATGANIIHLQPVPFSHEHHVGLLGFDCRYCHTTVDKAAFAGMPPTKTCMNCHSQIWVGSQMLEPVRTSYRADTAILWQRVHNLQQFVYFDHRIHVSKGVGCVTCHGRVDRMPLMRQQSTLLMEWCLDCHRQPEQYLRPREEVFNMAWTPSGNQAELGRELAKKYGVRSLTSCSVCHR